MGTPDQGYGKIGNIAQKEASRLALQSEIDQKKDLEERRRLGQFSTPYELADEIARFGLSLLETEKIEFLEPCIGTGAFYSALLSKTGDSDRIKSATGIELDASYFACASKLWGETGIHLIHDDFTMVSPDKKYNLVLTNPPYVRHHYLTQLQKTNLAESVKSETQIHLSGLSGLYCYFLLLAHKWLSPNAICGWLIPSEFMDVNYGSEIKDYLTGHVRLIRIHRYDPESSKFSDALVSSCVVWFKNEKISDDYDVEFTFGGTHDAPLKKKTVKKSELAKEHKWTRFPEKEVRSQEAQNFVLGDYFDIKRGIATGDNAFFILTREKIKELGMDMSFFRPILPSPRYLKTDLVAADERGVPQIEQQFFLLDCSLPEEELKENYPAVWRYLKTGAEKTGGKYLCKNRKRWYLQEQRETTFFLCSYMGRGREAGPPIRFILNFSDAIATNSYLMLYPKENLKEIIISDPDSVFGIWKKLREIKGAAIEEEGRIYGGGLKKIEPKELAKVPCENLLE